MYKYTHKGPNLYISGIFAEGYGEGGIKVFRIPMADIHYPAWYVKLEQ